MKDLGLRARSVSEIVDTAFQLYRQNPVPFIIVTALAYTPWLIVQLLLIGAVGIAGGAGNANLAWSAAAIAALGVWIGFSLMSTMIVALASKAYLGRLPDVATTVREVLPRLPAVMVAALLRYLMLFIGFLFFIAGALWVTASYFAVTPAIVIEGLGPVAAFPRSSTLSRGRKWHIISTLGLVALIYYVLAVAVGVATALLGSTVVSAVSSAVFTIVAYPLIGITEMLLYYDARIRGEGFDIEVMAASLTGAVADPHAQRAP